MPQPSHFILVDGGGTKTLVRLIASDGTPLGEARSGPSSLTFGTQAAWRNVAEAIRDVCRSAGLDPTNLRDAAFIAGFAGGRSPAFQAEFRALDPFGFRDIIIVTDGFTSLLGAHDGRTGSVLAIGTGVAAYALGADGRVRSSSGWGFIVGDEGSGAWIGRDALRALTQHIDGRMRRGSSLFAPLKAVVGEDFNAIQTWINAARPTQFASLAPLVIAAAEQGDGLANDLLDEASRHLETAILAIHTDGALALLGGLAHVFAPRFSPEVRNLLVEPKGPALDGLAVMARRGWTSEEIPAGEVGAGE